VTSAGIFTRVNGVTIQLLDFGNTRVAKAWASLTLGVSGAVTVDAGFNVSSASYSGSDLTVNFTNAIGSTNYAIVLNSMDTNGIFLFLPRTRSTGSAVIRGYNPTTQGTIALSQTVGGPILIVVFAT